MVADVSLSCGAVAPPAIKQVSWTLNDLNSQSKMNLHCAIAECLVQGEWTITDNSNLCLTPHLSLSFWLTGY